MKTYCVATNLETKQFEWISYQNQQVVKCQGEPVTFTAIELSAFYREKYSDDVKCKVFS